MACDARGLRAALVKITDLNRVISAMAEFHE